MIVAAALLLAGAVRADPLVLGPFSGLLPCVDCPGIPAELTLRRRALGWAEGTYTLREKRPGQRGVTVTTGDWTILRGDAVNNDAMVFLLDPNDPIKSRYFLKVGDRAVQALDDNLRPYPEDQPSMLQVKSKRR